MGRVRDILILVISVILFMLLAYGGSRAASVVSTITFGGYTTAQGLRHKNLSTATQAKLNAKTNNPHMTNMSSHWFKSDSSKLDTTTFNYFEAQTVSSLATKTPHETFKKYTSEKKDITKGDKGDRGYDARPAFTAVILDGFQSVNYDSNGQNPMLSSSYPFAAYLFDGTSAVSADRILSYDWYIPATDTMLTPPAYEVDGAQNHRQTYMPGVFSLYSSRKSNNYVRVNITHISGRTASVRIPVAIHQRGIQGIQGIQGPPASVSRSAMSAAMSNVSTGQYASDEAWQWVPYSNMTSAWLIAVRDKEKNVRMKINGHGYAQFVDINGHALTKVNQGVLSLLTNDVTRLEIRNDGRLTTYNSAGAIGFRAYSSGAFESWLNGAIRFRYSPRTGLVMYRNGLPVYEIYSGGKYKGPEGWPTNINKTRNYTRADGYRGYTTGGSGGGSATLPNPFTLPATGQTYQSPAGTARHNFYTSGRTIFRGSLTII